MRSLSHLPTRPFRVSVLNMKSDESTRPYRMKARAESAARTARAILDATAELWHQRPLDDITLQAIADRAGVSVQTVLRKFDSKKGVFDACIERESAAIGAERNRTPEGDVGAALDTLLPHYERDGDAVVRTLRLEDRLEAARSITRRGRSAHRQWCARVFAPFLPSPDEDGYRRRLDAFVAATDVYLWKLLRRDLNRSRAETRAALRALLDGLARSHGEQP